MKNSYVNLAQQKRGWIKDVKLTGIKKWYFFSSDISFTGVPFDPSSKKGQVELLNKTTTIDK